MTNDPGTTGTPGEDPAPGTPPPYQPPAPSYGSDPQPPVYGAPPQPPPAYGSEPPAAPGAPQYGAAPQPPPYGAPQPPYGAAQPPYGAPPPYGAGAPGGYPVPGVTSSKVKTALYVGIGGIVMSMCCSPVGIGLGITSVVLATQAEKQALPGNPQQAKIVGFVAIGFGVLSLIVGGWRLVSMLSGG